MAGGKTRLQEDLELLATYRLARMSVPTMAMMLSRSTKWIAARLEELEKAEQEATATCATSESSSDHVRSPDPKPVTAGSTHRRHRAPAGGPRALAIEQLKPVTARVAGWAWWFKAAGWPMDVVAGLFDRDADALAQAVEALG